MNIEPINANGVHEIFVIGTALKNAKAIVEELPHQDIQSLQPDEAIAIVDKIVEKGFNSVIS